jgi:hypothetical protein
MVAVAVLVITGVAAAACNHLGLVAVAVAALVILAG